MSRFVWSRRDTSYVDQFEGAHRVAGTRVSLDSIVYAFNGGHSPGTIAQSFPVLTLEQVYGSIAYYLGHREEIDPALLRGPSGPSRSDRVV